MVTLILPSVERFLFQNGTMSGPIALMRAEGGGRRDGENEG